MTVLHDKNSIIWQNIRSWKIKYTAVAEKIRSWAENIPSKRNIYGHRLTLTFIWMTYLWFVGTVYLTRKYRIFSTFEDRILWPTYILSRGPYIIPFIYRTKIIEPPLSKVKLSNELRRDWPYAKMKWRASFRTPPARYYSEPTGSGRLGEQFGEKVSWRTQFQLAKPI